MNINLNGSSFKKGIQALAMLVALIFMPSQVVLAEYHHVADCFV
jgi:hypothetical protein